MYHQYSNFNCYRGSLHVDSTLALSNKQMFQMFRILQILFSVCNKQSGHKNETKVLYIQNYDFCLIVKNIDNWLLLSLEFTVVNLTVLESFFNKIAGLTENIYDWLLLLNTKDDILFALLILLKVMWLFRYRSLWSCHKMCENQKKNCLIAKQITLFNKRH